MNTFLLKQKFLINLFKGFPNGVCIFFNNPTLSTHRVGDIQFLGLICKTLFDDGKFYEVMDEHHYLLLNLVDL